MKLATSLIGAARECKYLGCLCDSCALVWCIHCIGAGGEIGGGVTRSVQASNYCNGIAGQALRAGVQDRHACQQREREAAVLTQYSGGEEEVRSQTHQ